MEIKNANLKFNGRLQTLYLSQVKYIMIHHTAHPTWNVHDVHNYHLRSNGWIGIGYNFFIEKDGTIYEGRGFNVGAGATGYNKNSLHVCFAGNFETQEPTEEQLESGEWLVKYLLNMCSNDTKVVGHKDIGNTACPGKNFPLDKFKVQKPEKIDTKKERIKELQSILNDVYNSNLMVDGIIGVKTNAVLKKVLLKNYCSNELVEFVQKRLVAYGYNVDGIDGKFGSKTENAVRNFQKAKRLSADGIVGFNTITALI